MRFSVGQSDENSQIKLLDCSASFVFDWHFANDLALKQFSAVRKESAGANQIFEPLFCDQTTNCHDQERRRGKTRASEFSEIQAVVNAMDAIGAFWKSFS